MAYWKTSTPPTDQHILVTLDGNEDLSAYVGYIDHEDNIFYSGDNVSFPSSDIAGWFPIPHFK